jgi:hypothetical protein
MLECRHGTRIVVFFAWKPESNYKSMESSGGTKGEHAHASLKTNLHCTSNKNKIVVHALSSRNYRAAFAKTMLAISPTNALPLQLFCRELHWTTARIGTVPEGRIQ